MGDIKYRKSIKEDIPEINDLFVEMIRTVNSRMQREGLETFDNCESGFEEGYLEQFYINDERLIYVALDEEKVVGFLSVINKKEYNNIYLDDYCVKEEYRGRGIGSKLMNMSFAFAEEQGYDQVYTHVAVANKESIEMYNKKGFKIIANQGNRFLIRRVDNHLSTEKQNALFEYNQKIIDKVMKKINSECHNSVDIVGIAGSYCSELFHENSDLDLLIVANDDVDVLSKCFILDGIGQDIYYSKWNKLESMANYDNMFVTKLKDLKIFYYRDEESLNKYKELQKKLDLNMTNEERKKEIINKYISSVIAKKNSIQIVNSLNECIKLVGSLMSDIENIIYINNSQYQIGGTKNILTEMYYMSKQPKGFIDEYKRILDFNDIEDIREWSTKIVELLLLYFGLENNNIDLYKNNEESKEKKNISGSILVGIYEELYSNYYNKLLYASKSNNKFLSFRTMIDAQGFFDEFYNEFDIPEFDLVDKYNSNDLKQNVNAFEKCLDQWKKLYDEFGIQIQEYDTVEEIYEDEKMKRV